MLKALELIGFKSFADKTRFEFPDGITVVVGPNGSGKSNIVDAIKWVLGAQSAKSLRGKDMSDVIFKGSGSGGRRAMNTAEATIVFDNQDGLLAIDAAEVRITRRVYRSGEGEYLINREPCRLRDVRDLFRGTGVGTDAYSLIEQGKVDRMLQASPRERRAIFEEAAGISRFKAKKVEAQRRLDRVEQNLLRLSDIVEEVESRLRSVRSQASKARRYREYSQRLQELRTHVGLVDWHQLSEKLARLDAELTRLEDDKQAAAAEIEVADAELLELDTLLASAGEQLRGIEGQAASNREQIATRESAMEHQWARLHDLDQEAAAQRETLALMNLRADDVQQRIDQTRQMLDLADSEHTQLGQRQAGLERELDDLTRKLDQAREDGQSERQKHQAGVQQLGELDSQLQHLQIQCETAQGTVQRGTEKLAELERAGTQYQHQLDGASAEEQTVADQLSDTSAQLDDTQRELAENRRLLRRRQEELSAMQGRFSGAVERADVLQELEKRLEGLSSGVKDVLALKASDPHGDFADVVGLVADLVRVDVQWATLVDVALGAVAQHIAVRGNDLFARIQSGAFQPSGRVGFVALDGPADGEHVEPRRQDADLSELPGVLGRADRVAGVDEQARPFIERLLGRTWFVKTISDAVRLHRQYPQLRFVTAQGEIVESDGTIEIGPRHSAVGLVSRRSELRALRQQIAVLEQQIESARGETARLEENIQMQGLAAAQLTEEQQVLTSSLSDKRIATRTLQERCQQLAVQQQTLQSEVSAAKEEVAGCQEQMTSMQQRCDDLNQRTAQLASSIQTATQQLSQLQQLHRKQDESVTAGRIELARSEQQLDSLRTRWAQFQEDQSERNETIAEARRQLTNSLTKGGQAQQSILATSADVAELYLHKEDLTRRVQEQLETRQTRVQQRADLSSRLQHLRQQIRETEECQHKQALAAGEVRHQRAAMADRLRDDYGIEIAELQAQESAQEQQQRQEVEAEIDGLRRKINNIGAVNMAALDELDELETRFESLSGQYRDLAEAKEVLQRIIQRINADSRRLFTETLEAIRANFQELYRKAFGGGRADIVLEEGVDVLECGVEIVATPPGKPSFNNSLLSGGEKALTAVALLLAIFQFRPSPFCVLDEVDAPFDEANIGRFVGVLNEFLAWTKFVIVTHSKKTMTAANTLYGVTMQESGISKRVSVKFDDVTEDGHILPEAVERESQAESAGDDDERAA